MKIISILLLTICINCFGQNQANLWYFGNGVGLDFKNGCTPTVLTDGKIDGFEGCATISDKVSGQLLFYTNSDTVWNRNHIAMPNGQLVRNGRTITQVMILEQPASDSIFYIVTAEVQGFSGEGLRLHGVNMNLNGGLGGLIFKDSVLYSSAVTEKITAVRHANGTDIWLIAHEYNSNNFLSFLISSSGINPIPIISPIGKIHFDASSFDAIGEMKASPSGSKLSVVTGRQPNIELFDFNNLTGQLSNPIVLLENGGYDLIGNPSGLYGLSFSANSSMLYASKWNLPSLGSPGQVMQFNITSNDSALINNSRVNVFTSTSKSLYSLKLAPNRKIYVGQNVNGYIGVIDAPDNAGLSCNYIDNGLYLNGKQSSWGLNNLMEYGDYCNEPTGQAEIWKEDLNIKIYPNPADNQINLEFDNINKENFSLTIYDSRGQLVRKMTNISTDKLTIDRQNLKSGLYFIQLLSERQTVMTGKFIFE